MTWERAGAFGALATRRALVENRSSAIRGDRSVVLKDRSLQVGENEVAHGLRGRPASAIVLIRGSASVYESRKPTRFSVFVYSDTQIEADIIVRF